MSYLSTSARQIFLGTTGTVNVVKKIVTFFSIHRERAALRKLDASLLEDIGITRAEAEMEANRPAWDAPERWRR